MGLGQISAEYKQVKRVRGPYSHIRDTGASDIGWPRAPLILRKVVGRNFVLTAAEPAETRTEELAELLSDSGKNSLGMTGTPAEGEVAKGRCLSGGALVDYRLGEMLLAITQDANTQTPSMVPEGAPV